MNLKLRRRARRLARSKSTIGVTPGRIVAPEGSVKGSLRVIHYTSKSVTDNAVASVADLSRFVRDLDSSPLSNLADEMPTTVQDAMGVDTTKRSRGVTWINIDSVGDAKMLKELSKIFDIHPLAMEDVVNVHQHAKMDSYGTTVFFVTRMPSKSDVFHTEQVSLFLIDNVVITIQERPGDSLEPVRQRIANKLGRVRFRGADYLAYAIIDAIIDGYFTVLQNYADKLDEADRVLQSNSNRNLPLQVHDIRNDLLLIRKVLYQHRTAIMTLLRQDAELIASDTALYFRDCQDHVQQLIEAVDTDRETCGELRELYFAMLGERNNDVTKVLTIISTIFIPMSFVAGVYGMNFNNNVSRWNMPELHWVFGYPFALSLMAVMAIGLMSYMFRKGWLRSS